jgi:uracil-DNA glycosylase
MKSTLSIPRDYEEKIMKSLDKERVSHFFEYITQEYRECDVFPSQENVFNALKLTPFTKVNVVIVGQDPYHGEGQAHGLSFSVPEGVKLPPSLKNIYKEIESDLGVTKDMTSGNLEYLAKQGVLLLNSVMTVRAGTPLSHQGKGWEAITDAIISKIGEEKEGVVFMLWGNYAKSKRSLIDERKHLVLTAAHPSPFSAYSGFFGCKHFSLCNTYLKKHRKDAILW